MDEIPPGDYTLRIVATDPGRPSDENAILRNRIRIRDNGVCIIHTIRNGVTVEENTMTIDFLSTGVPGPTGYLCSLDRARFVECKYYSHMLLLFITSLCTLSGSSPYSIQNLPIGKHRIKVVPQGCGQNFQAYTQKFTVV